MRAMFLSRTKDIPSSDILINASMLASGEDIYVRHTMMSKKLSLINDENYIPMFDLYTDLKVEPYSPMSKRKLYKEYKSGVVVGAGSGTDCEDIIDNKNFTLIDLSDKRMHNFAAGYENKKGVFNSASLSEGDTLNSIDEKYGSDKFSIDVKTIDSLNLKRCGLISIDAEGAGLDVLLGSLKTIENLRPNLLISIYHNWLEYLHIIPLITEFGYDIHCHKTVNFLGNQPQLELVLFCSKEKKCTR